MHYRVVDLSAGRATHGQAAFAVLLARFRDLGIVPGVPSMCEFVPVALARLALVEPVLLLETLSGRKDGAVAVGDE